MQLKQKKKGPYAEGPPPAGYASPGKGVPDASKAAANDETKAQHEALNKRAMQLIIK